VTTLEQSFWTPGAACSGLIALIGRYTQMLGSAAVVGLVFSWPAAAALVAATMVFRRGQRGGLRVYGRLFFTNIGMWREANYYRATALRAAAAKRSASLGWVAGCRTIPAAANHSAEVGLGRAEEDLLRPVPRVHGLRFCRRFAHARGLGRTAAAGTISLTQLALGLQAGLATLRLGEHFPEADAQTQFGMLAYDGVEGFERGVAAFHEKTIQLEPRRESRGLPEREIRFEGVDFHYPGSERPVLDHLNLALPAGRCTAIVGLNGAGKTTLVSCSPGCMTNRRPHSGPTTSTSAPSAWTTGAARSGSSSRTSTATS